MNGIDGEICFMWSFTLRKSKIRTGIFLMIMRDYNEREDEKIFGQR